LKATKEVDYFENIYTIPSSMIQTAESVIRKAKQSIPNIENLLNKVFHSKSVHDFTMEDQDMVLALGLMKECALGESSEFYPYMKLLPKEKILRLDSLSDKALEILEDAELLSLAKNSQKRIKNAWFDSKLSELVSMLIKGDEKVKYDAIVKSCSSLESFIKFISIISSRAMVLNGKKYLCPLADMANYESRNDLEKRHPFTLFHHLRNDGSISVKCDRHVEEGEQIYEDYGDTDNSLFLEAHGFVPDENPFHCATIQSKYLPSFESLPEKNKNDYQNSKYFS